MAKRPNDNNIAATKTTPDDPAKAAKEFAKNTAAQKAAIQASADAMEAARRAAEKYFQTTEKVAESSIKSADAIQKISDNAKEQVKKLASVSDSLESVSEGQKVYNDLLKLGSKAVKNASKDITKQTNDFSKNSKAATAAAVALKTFGATIKGLKAIFGGVTGVIGKFVELIWEVGSAIVSAPFMLMESLIGRAKEAMRQGLELATAREEVREIFGDISKGTSKDVINIGRSLATGVIAPGLMARQVFGTFAEALDRIRELAAETPVLFQKLGDQFNNSGLQIMSMASGLGIAKEELAGLQARAVATGEPLTATLSEVTKYAKGLGAQFGINSKAMSRDMGRAMKDVKHFANATVKEVAQATVYAHKLGLELKDITGVLDAFNTFDQAAENVAKLSQAFGVNIDLMKLMEAETSADALDEIKKAFTAAGKSADQMSRHELQLIAQTVGMDEAVVRQSLSMKNAGVSMDAVKSSASALQAQTMDTGQAITALASDIKRLVKEGQAPEGKSFFEIFFEGFKKGIDLSGEFQKLIQDVMKDMWIVRDAGMRVGQAFVKFFPGFTEFLRGLRAFLDPAKMKSLMSGVTSVFTDFFKQLGNGTATFEGLIEALQTKFITFFNNDKGGRLLLGGLTKMWKAVERIISTGLDWLTEKLKTGIQFLVDLLSGKYADKLSAAGKGILGGLDIASKSPIVKSLINAYEQLKDPLGQLFEKVFNLAIDKLGEILLKYKWEIALVTLGPTLGNLALQAFIGAMQNKALANTLSDTLTKAGVGKTTPGAAGGVPGAAGGMGKLGQVTLVATAAIIGFETGKAIADSILDSWEKQQESFRQGSMNSAEALANLNVSAQSASRSIKNLGGLSKEEAQKIVDQKKAAEDAIAAQESKLANARAVAARTKASQNVQGVAGLAGIGGLATAAQLVGSLGEYTFEGKDFENTMFGEQLFAGAAMSPEQLKDLEKQLADDQAKYKEFLDKHGSNLAVIADTASGKIPEKIAEAAADNSADMLEKLGLDAEFTIETAAEQLKKVDELAKKVLSKDFNLPETIAQIKEKLSTVKWDIISLESEKELKKSAEVMGSLQKVFESIKNSLSSVYESAQVSSKLGTAGGGGLIDNYKTGVLSLLLVAIEIKQSLQKLDFSVIKEKVEPLKNAFEAIKEAITPAKDVADLLKKSFSSDKSEELGTHTENFKKSIDKINKGLGGIATTSGYTSVATTTAAQNVQSTGEAIKTSFTPLLESIGMLAYLPKALAQTVSALSDPTFFSNIASLGKILGNEGEEYSIASKFSSIADLSEMEVNVASWITDSTTILNSVKDWTGTDGFIGLDEVTKSVISAEDKFSRLFGAMSFIEDHIRGMAELDFAQAVGKMVENINSMNVALSNVNIGKDGQVRVKLAAAADGIMKADQVFNIKKAPININMEVHVELAVSDVEKVILKPGRAVGKLFDDLAGKQTPPLARVGNEFQPQPEI
jgi:hypothetical protein